MQLLQPTKSLFSPKELRIMFYLVIVLVCIPLTSAKQISRYSSEEENELPQLDSYDKTLIGSLLSKLLKDNQFLGNDSDSDELIENRYADMTTLSGILSNVNTSTIRIQRNPFDGVTQPQGRQGLLPGFAQAFRNISSQFLEQVISSANRLIGLDGTSKGQQPSSSKPPSSNNNQVTSVGANTLGVGEGDVPHRPVSNNGKPTGVEPPRPEGPDLASVAKIPTAVVNQTTGGISSAGSGSA